MSSNRPVFKRVSLVMALLLFGFWGFAQDRTLSGTVTDANDGTTLPGATIMEKGTTNGTITDMDGNYTLKLTGSNPVITISFVGFETREVEVGEQTTIDVSLDMAMDELSEVVVIGYGTQKKKVATGSISKVKAENLEGYKVPSVQSALDGQVSGVIVNETSGQPGSGKSILIRGISTNGDNSPLYIVDGLTVSSIDNINPSDIESIDVLKDAASTAIYGARAANGVIIISTKQGTGEGSITYEGFTSYANPWKKPEMLNANQYVELIREKFSNSGQTAQLDNRGFPTTGEGAVDTDWMDEIFDQSTMVNHRLSATMNNSYLSLEYWDQNGVIGGEKSNYKRYAIRINSTKDINDLISIGQNLYLNRTENQNLGTNNAFGTLVADAFAYDPLTEVYDADAEYGFAQSEWVQKEYINPLSRLFLADNDGHADQIQGNAYVKIKPIEGLTISSDLGVDFSWYNYRSFRPDYNYHAAFNNPNNSIAQGYGFGQRLQFENYVNYQKDFGLHSINAVVGTTNISQEFETAGGSTINIPDAVKFNDQFQYIDAAPTDTIDLAFGSAAVDYRLVSYYGRLIYDYNDKYLFSATLRRDGSSRFGANNRWGIFPSFSLGWVVSDEAFFPTSPISFLKVRGSWGVNGSDRIGDLRYASRIENAFSYTLGMSPALNQGSTLATIPNPNLKWEESVQLDVGVELKLFNDQLSTEFDYYIKTTRDLLGTEVIPGYVGATNFPISNLGEIQNKGFEASISYRQRIGELNFRSTLNYTTFKNTTVEIPGTTEFINGWSWPVRNTAITRMTEGQPVGHFVGYKTLGIFQDETEVFGHISNEGDVLQPDAQPGDLIFDDINGDGAINSDDLTSIGSPWPDHIFGLNLSADYKGFDINILFSTQIGHDIYRTYERSDVPFSNMQSFWMDRWTESNPSTEYPRLVLNDNNGNQNPSDFYVEDGSFLRLRNLQIGYNLPSSLLDALRLKSLRIYFSANNLLTLTGYKGFDPEIGTDGWILNTGIDKGYYPSNKTLGGGIRISM